MGGESDEQLFLLLSEASEFLTQQLDAKQHFYSFDFSAELPITEGRYQWSIHTLPPTSKDDSCPPDET
jgi:hypothetical protein